MKILVVHNTYQKRGGEDVAVEREVDLLRHFGLEVNLQTVSNQTIQGLSSKINAFVNTPYNPKAEQWARDLIRMHNPDIVHIHNFFPLISPSFHVGAAKAGAAVVQTLHNYRLLCSNGMLLRDSVPCEKCITDSRLWGVFHGCYRNSMMATSTVAAMQQLAFSKKIWHQHVHRFIALTEFGRKKFIEGGLPIQKLQVKPNFASAPDGEQSVTRSGVLYVGRLSPEKGVDLLVNIASRFTGETFTIAGDGPDREKLESVAPKNVKFMGQLSRNEVSDLMLHAKVLVVPSLWYEGLPMNIVEAFSAGLPVIASDIGALSELVEFGKTGVLFKVGDETDLEAKLNWLLNFSDYLEMCKKTAQTHREKFSPEINFHLLLNIYRNALLERSNSFNEPA